MCNVLRGELWAAHALASVRIAGAVLAVCVWVDYALVVAVSGLVIALSGQCACIGLVIAINSLVLAAILRIAPVIRAQILVVARYLVVDAMVALLPLVWDALIICACVVVIAWHFIIRNCNAVSCPLIALRGCAWVAVQWRTDLALVFALVRLRIALPIHTWVWRWAFPLTECAALVNADRIFAWLQLKCVSAVVIDQALNLVRTVVIHALQMAALFYALVCPRGVWIMGVAILIRCALIFRALIEIVALPSPINPRNYAWHVWRARAVCLRRS